MPALVTANKARAAIFLSLTEKRFLQEEETLTREAENLLLSETNKDLSSEALFAALLLLRVKYLTLMTLAWKRTTLLWQAEATPVTYPIHTANTATGKHLAAITPETLTPQTARTAATRISGAVSWMMNETYNQGLLAQAREEGKRTKIWVTRISQHTCDECLAMHGKTSDLEASFQMLPGLQSFGTMITPPRHPRCRCRITFI